MKRTLTKRGASVLRPLKDLGRGAKTEGQDLLERCVIERKGSQQGPICIEREQKRTWMVLEGTDDRHREVSGGVTVTERGGNPSITRG